MPDQDDVIADYTGIEDEERGDPLANQGEAAVEPKEEEPQAGDAELGCQERARALPEEETHERVQFGATPCYVRQGEQGVEDMEHKDHDKDRGQTQAKLVDVNRLGISSSTRPPPPPTQEGVATQGRRRAPSAIASEPLYSGFRFHHNF